MIRLEELCEQVKEGNKGTILLNFQELDAKEVEWQLGNVGGEVGELGLTLGIWNFPEPGT